MIGKQIIVSEITKKLREVNNWKKEIRVEDVFDSFLEVLEELLVNGQRVIFQNLFSLDSISRPARKGKNPRTGKEISIPERKSIALKVSSNLKDKINQK